MKRRRKREKYLCEKKRSVKEEAAKSHETEAEAGQKKNKRALNNVIYEMTISNILNKVAAAGLPFAFSRFCSWQGGGWHNSKHYPFS